ncbi:MAG: glycosyltransferase family 39 protein [Acidobacteria bacterium]|nr:glycosyltransferase family 39 protein [Acidobacteriota bacterium]
MPRRPLLVALLAAAALPYFIGLGDSSIWDANEAFYAETPREMIAAGDYINPSFNDLPRFNKPVLSYWVVAGFYKAFGVSVAVERIPIALSALALMGVAFGLARAIKSTEAGLWAAIAIASSPRVLMFARRIFIDMWVTMFMALTLLWFVLAERSPERRGRYLVLMYASAGLGMLTKGPVAIVLPGLVFLAWLLWQRRLGDITRMRPILGAAIVLAIVAPWYVALYAQHGWQHIVGFFWGENVARYADAVAPERGLLFYPPVVIGDLFPWSLLLLPAALLKPGQSPVVFLRRLLWLWLIVIVGFFTLSATKQDLYIFPVTVAVAALAGEVLAGGGTRERWTRWMLALAGTLLWAGAVIVQRVFGGGGAHDYQLDGVLAIVVIAGTAGLAATMLALVSRIFAAALTIAVCMVALNWVFVLRTLPSFERYKPVVPMSDAIKARAGRDAAVLHYNVAMPSMVFYLQRHVDQFYEDPAPLLEKIRASPEYYLVLGATDYAALGAELPARTCVIERRPLFDMKLKNVLAGKTLPELVLVTNRCG